MNIYISADIEGISGITSWDEARKEHGDYPPFAERMTQDVRAACEAALEVGAKRIVVKDAHATGRNLDHDKLPAPVELIRGWSGHPSSMVQDIDGSFDALLLIGYHAPAGADTNPLCHTMSGKNAEVWLNGRRCSEFLLYGTLAATYGVPTVLVAGDDGLAEHVKAVNPHITTLGTGRGIGASVHARHPRAIRQELADRVKEALLGDIESCLLPLADEYALEIEYKTYQDAYHASFFPGTERVAERRVRFASDDYFEILRAVKFIL